MYCYSYSKKKPKVFVHVSTAFANCDQKYITEEIFKPPVMPDRAIEAAEFLHEDIFAMLTPKMIHPRPNSYTYTKAIAEYLVFKESTNLPIVILRPSIVGATWLEPHVGWIDNFNGPTGLFQAHSLGLIRTMIGRREATADIIPVDVVINMMIVAAWHTGSKKSTNLYVYNCTCDKVNRLTWGGLEKMSNHLVQAYPASNMLLIPYFRFTTFRFECFLILKTQPITHKQTPLINYCNKEQYLGELRIRYLKKFHIFKSS